MSRLEDIRARHVPSDHTATADDRSTDCFADGKRWPCDTAQALAALDAAEAEAKALAEAIAWDADKCLACREPRAHVAWSEDRGYCARHERTGPALADRRARLAGDRLLKLSGGTR